MAWQAVVIEAGLKVAVWLANKYIFTYKRKQPRPRPSEIDFPTTQLGRGVPVIYGTVRVEDLQLVWLDNVKHSWAPQIQQMIYEADMLFVIGTPPGAIPGVWIQSDLEVPSITKFWYGDREVAMAGGQGILHGNHEILNPNTLSAHEDFKAVIEFLDGRPTQVTTGASPILAIDDAYVRAGYDQNKAIGFRYQMLLGVFASKGFYSGNSQLGTTPTIASMGALVRARGAGANHFAVEFYDANPAWVIYDLICGPVHKLGLPIAKVDLASFQTVAAILNAEVNGCSVAVYEDTDFTDLLAGLLDQIDGVLYHDKTDDKIKIRLIRADYDPTLIPQLDATNILNDPQPNVKITSWQDAANQVDVKYINRNLQFKEDIVSAHRLSVSVGQDGRRRVRTVDYPFCTGPSSASKLAARELAVAGRPVMTMTLAINRIPAANNLNMGDAVRVNLPDRNINFKVFRVVEADYGQLGDGRINLSLIEDVFGVTAGGNGIPETPLSPYLLPIHERYQIEAPHYFTMRKGQLGQTVFDAQYVMTIAIDDDDDLATAYKTSMNFTGDDTFSSVGVPATLPPWIGQLTQPYPREAEPFDQQGLYVDFTESDAATIAAGFVGTSATQQYIASGNLLAAILWKDADGVVRHEFISFESFEFVSGSTYKLLNVWRGLLDTPPIAHPAGARLAIYVDETMTSQGSITPNPGETPSMDITTIPIGGGLTGSGDDPVDQVIITQRFAKPLPPSDFGVLGFQAVGVLGAGGTGYLKKLTNLDGAIEFVAKSRLRTYGYVTRGDSGSQGGEATTVYSIHAQKVYDLEPDAPETEVTIVSGLPDATTTGMLLGKAGFGSIDLKLRSTQEIAFSADPVSHFDSTIRIEAPRWRNLINNGKATDGGGAPSTAGWTASSGSIQTVVGATGLQRSLNGRYFAPLTQVGGTTFYQDVDVSGFVPRGLGVLLEFYYRGLSGDANDTITAQIIPRDSLGSTVFPGAAIPAPLVVTADGVWKRVRLALSSLGDGVQTIRVLISCTGVTNPVALIGISDIYLGLGRATGNLLANPSFDALAATLSMTAVSFADPSPVSTTMSHWIYVAAGNQNQTTLSCTVVLTYPSLVDPGAPPSVILPGSWTGGAWVWNGGAGTYTRTFTSASQVVGTEIIQITSYTGGTAGTLTTTPNGSSTQVGVATATADTTSIINYSLNYTMTDSPDPVAHLGTMTYTVTPTVGGGTQNNLSMTVVLVWSNINFTPGAPPTDGTLNGWTRYSGWTQLTDGFGHPIGWTATFHRTSHPVGSANPFTFTVSAGGGVGAGTIDSNNAGNSSEIGSASIGNCSTTIT